MLGDFITRCLILVFGYAYPAFECYKIVEKNRVEIDQLRFWCKYWILVAMLTVLERFLDAIASWYAHSILLCKSCTFFFAIENYIYNFVLVSRERFPMYGELKLAFFIYLWSPKTQGTGFVYQSVLRPYVSKHETDIDRRILELRARLWDLAIYYWQNCAQLSQEKFFDIIKFLAGQSARFSNAPAHENQKHNGEKQHAPSAPPPPENGFNSPRTPKPGKSKFGFGSPRSSTINRAVSEPTKSNLAQVNMRVTSEPGSPEDGYIPDSPTTPGTPNESLLQARQRLRRQKPQH
ncbi:hypothetical protein CUMW_005010 [Citrus unshiu]|nr:hypothetical protein CUMW_005010 [Citrus unshiu]